MKINLAYYGEQIRAKVKLSGNQVKCNNSTHKGVSCGLCEVSEKYTSRSGTNISVAQYILYVVREPYTICITDVNICVI
jgi:hypothetical protein